MRVTRPFADTGDIVNDLCVAGEQPDAKPWLRAFVRSDMNEMTVHNWYEAYPPDGPDVISRGRYCYHESFCHLPWPG